MNLLEKRRDVMLPPQEWRENRASRVGVAAIGASYRATPGLIKFGILFLDAKFAKNKNSKLPKLSGCLYV
jgi:hypothetical protein